MAGTLEGAERAAAKRLGVTPEFYQEQRQLGRKHCGGCRQWLYVERFGLDMSRGDFCAPQCRDCKNTRERFLYGGR